MKKSVASRFPLSKTLISNFDAIKHFPMWDYPTKVELKSVRTSYPPQTPLVGLHWACTKRIEGDESGHKHCTGQYFDYWHCIDKCVAVKLFDHLK